MFFLKKNIIHSSYPQRHPPRPRAELGSSTARRTDERDPVSGYIVQPRQASESGRSGADGLRAVQRGFKFTTRERDERGA